MPVLLFEDTLFPVIVLLMESKRYMPRSPFKVMLLFSM